MSSPSDLKQSDSTQATSKPTKKARSLSGCMVKSSVASLLLLGLGIYLLGRWDALGGARRAGAILSVVIGSVLLIPLLTGILLAVLKFYLAKKLGGPVKEMFSSAREVVEQNKKIYAGAHKVRDAVDADFIDRDRAWYDRSTAELQALGFECVGDHVNVTVLEATGLVVVLRRFLSKDHSTMGAIYQFVRPNKVTGEVADIRVCDLESEMSNGDFLTTSNAEQSKHASLPPQIHSTKHPANTPPAEIARLHELSKQTYVEQHPQTQWVLIHNALELDQAQRRQQEIKSGFRKSVGYVDAAEVERIAADKFPDNPEAVEMVKAKLDVAKRMSEMDGQSDKA